MPSGKKKRKKKINRHKRKKTRRKNRHKKKKNKLLCYNSFTLILKNLLSEVICLKC